MRLFSLYTWLLGFVLGTGMYHTVYASNKQRLQEGWQLLIQDKDVSAIRLFNESLNQAIDEKDIEGQANAFLYIGIASYGASLHNGMHYASEALRCFEQLGNAKAAVSREGRGKCLQLIATIKAREGNRTEAMALSREALTCFPENDTTGYVALIHFTLGGLHEKNGRTDSADYYFQKALQERIVAKDSVYLPSSFIAAGNTAKRNRQWQEAFSYYQQAQIYANATGNRQAQVNTLLALSRLFSEQTKKQEANDYVVQAKAIAQELTDKQFLLQVLEQEKQNWLTEQNYTKAYAISEDILRQKDSIANYDAERLTKNLEVQFEVGETERKLLLIRKEHHIAKLTNYLLAGILLFLIIASVLIISFYRKIHAQSVKLAQTKQALLEATEEQKRLSEQTLQNELDFKESQLSALTIQMVQKNQFIEDIKEQLADSDSSKLNAISKVMHQHQVQDQEWEDFNKSFESVNKNFYTRIKQQYPDISPNELKICALIKMNLSIKEMASILTISPDSVKTARYRLRKKLNLQTEDNLTEFILTL